jgi:hypothetical protein
MKKILTLAVVICLVFATMTMALGDTELSSSIGGRFYGYSSTIKGDHGFNPAPGNDTWDTILAGTVKNDNGSWAQLSFIASSWEQTVNAAFGFDNIADSNWSMHFDTHDTGTCNLGQQFMGDLFNDFKADPYFNTCDMGGSFGVKYISDNLEFRAEADVYDGNGDTNNYDDGQKVTENVKTGFVDTNGNGVQDEGEPNVYTPTTTTNGDAYDEKYAAVLIFKNDYGKYYIGAKHKAKQALDDSFYIIGCDTTINDIGLKFDIWSDKAGYSNPGEFSSTFWGGKGCQTAQATISYDKWTGQLMFTKPEADNYDDVFGLGLAYQLTEKLNVGAKYFKVDADHVVTTDGNEADDNYYDVYGLYNLGAFDFKLGVSNAAFSYGQGGANNAGQSDNGSNSTYQPDDTFLYAGFHFEF